MIKLDMSKAYDRLSWSFILAALRSFGFFKGWCDLSFEIFQTFGTLSLLKGRLMGSSSLIGVCMRQGDPLSPALFMICMEWLSHNINLDVEREEIATYHTKRGAKVITHLFYADNVLLFVKGDSNSISNILNIFNKFGAASGQLLNLEKS